MGAGDAVFEKAHNFLSVSGAAIRTKTVLISLDCEKFSPSPPIRKAFKGERYTGRGSSVYSVGLEKLGGGLILCDSFL